MLAGLQQESNNRFASPFMADFQPTDGSLTDNRAHADSALLQGPPTLLDGIPDSTETAQTPSVSATTMGTSSTPVENATTSQAADGEKPKKGHRRGRSLTGLIPTLKTKPKRSQSQVLEVQPFRLSILTCCLHTLHHVCSLISLHGVD